jgi:hypothetical protein
MKYQNRIFHLPGASPGATTAARMLWNNEEERKYQIIKYGFKNHVVPKRSNVAEPSSSNMFLYYNYQI